MRELMTLKTVRLNGIPNHTAKKTSTITNNVGKDRVVIRKRTTCCVGNGRRPYDGDELQDVEEKSLALPIYSKNR